MVARKTMDLIVLVNTGGEETHDHHFCESQSCTGGLELFGIFYGRTVTAIYVDIIEKCLYLCLSFVIFKILSRRANKN